MTKQYIIAEIDENITYISLDPQFSIMHMCSASPKFLNEHKLNSLLLLIPTI